jgi:putative aldouronate transport system substrate-binding protein
MKKASLSLLVIMSMVVILFAGCSSKDKEAAPSSTVKEEATATVAPTEAPAATAAATEAPAPGNSWEKDKATPVKLTFFQDFPVDFKKNYGTNWLTKKMIEDTGVTLDIEAATDWSDNSLNLKIASGEYGDILYLQPAHAGVRSLIDHDALYSLAEIKEKTGIDLMARMNKYQVVNEKVRYDKDSIYMLPIQGSIPPSKLDDKYNITNLGGYIVNQQIYEEMGSPPVNNEADLLALLRKVQKAHPDLTPIQGTVNQTDKEPSLMFALEKYFGLSNPLNYVEPGKVAFAYQAPEYLHLLKFANTLIKERLVSPSEFTQSGDELWANIYSGKTFSILSQDADSLDLKMNGPLAKAKAGQNYEMLPLFSLVDGQKFVPAGENGLGGFLEWAIPKSTKNLDRAAAFLDYMSSEYFQKLNIFGVEGEHYDVVNGIPVLKKELVDERTNESDKFNAELGLNHFFGMRDDYWAMVDRVESATPIGKKAFETANANGFVNLNGKPENLIGKLGNGGYPPNSEELKKAIAIQDYMATEVTKTVMGKPEDVEKGYTNMMEKVKGMGLQSLVDFWTNEMKKYEDVVKKYE